MTDILNQLTDIKIILRSCPRNWVNAPELDNEKIELVALKSIQVINEILSEIRSCDANEIRDVIIKTLENEK
jgi:hypothetical protein